MPEASVEPPVDGVAAPQGIRDSGCDTRRVDSSSVDGALAEVIARGAPAQQLEAQRLRESLAQGPANLEAREAARALIDAYLHDPHLERGDTGRHPL